MSLVEYHDPDGLFPLVLPQLQPRLPLRNLHWQTPSRPVRSIGSLHVEFVPSTNNANTPTSSRDRPESAEFIKASSDTSRRHQIPGLRPTPYLKVFFLRCDDNETYKTSARKVLKDWLDPYQTSASTSEKNHDAFEWVIVHVVLPNTAAASQPRWSRSSGSEHDVLKEKSSKWPGRNSRTILERIRDDFNQVNKTTPDRVAQIRLAKNVVPPSFVPARPVSTSSANLESPKEVENAWNDLISKFKALILISFNLRVSQYEEDIREKDSQRSFPGWNFCTFFVLKEGLARVFEAVGLIEDALLIYDELSAGLDTTVNDHASEAAERSGNNFLPFTQDIHDHLISSLNHTLNSEVKHSLNILSSDRPLSSDLKDYRGLIVSNNISLFDFKCYLFFRQAALLSRIAHPQKLLGSNRITDTSNDPSTTAKADKVLANGDVEDIAAFADLCQLATQSITTLARLLRHDLLTGYETFESAASTNEASSQTIHELVSSWIFTATKQFLNDTISNSLPKAPASSSPAVQTLKGSPRVDASHNRRSSIPIATNSLNRFSQVHYESDKFNNRAKSKPAASGNNIGLSNVAAYRAELFLLQRKALKDLGAHCGIGININNEFLCSDQPRDNFAIDGVAQPQKEQDVSLRPEPSKSTKAGEVIKSAEAFTKLYHHLTDQALWFYNVAGRKKSVEKLTVDLATLAFNEGDFAAAAAYFGAMSSNFAESKWTSMEAASLIMYATCLKKLNRKDEHIRVTLALLARSAETRKSKPSSKINDVSTRYRTGLGSTLPNVQHLLSDLTQYSQQLPYEFVVPLSKYFVVLDTARCIELFANHDGFRLCLCLKQIIADYLTIDSVRIRLIDIEHGQSREIWLNMENQIELDASTHEIWLKSNVSTLGKFIIDQISIRSGKIVFVQETMTKTEATTPLGLSSSVAAKVVQTVKSSPVLVYPRQASLQANVAAAHNLHVGRRRHFEITLSSGSNHISSGQIVIRSASAGLRIRTAEATTIKGVLDITDDIKPGIVGFDILFSNQNAVVQIPFELEQSIPDLALRLEVHYNTEFGAFLFMRNVFVDAELPLDVNVQDIFKETAIFSKFLLRPINPIPLYITTAELQESESYIVDTALDFTSPVTVFAGEPFCLAYKIQYSPNVSGTQALEHSRLTLPFIVEYRTVEEDCIAQASAELKKSLEKSGEFQELENLISPALESGIRRLLSPRSYENVGITGLFSIPSFEELGWMYALEGLPKDVLHALLAWLDGWHKDHNQMRLLPPSDHSYQALFPSRRLTIDFEIPQIQYLHTVSLDLMKPKLAIEFKESIVKVGDHIPAQLKIKHTQHWNVSSSRFKPKESIPEFVYGLLFDPEVWLIGGQQHAHFTASENKMTVFDLVLIPLKSGHTLLPGVDIRPATLRLPDNTPQTPQSAQSVPQSAFSNTSFPIMEKPVNCETEYLSQCESVLVLQSTTSTTFTLGEDESLDAGSPILIESETR